MGTIIRLKTPTTSDAHVEALHHAGFDVVAEVAGGDAIELQAGGDQWVRLTSSIHPDDLVVVALKLAREQQLRIRVQALDHLERLAAIAHDINNALCPIVVAAEELGGHGSVAADDIAASCVRVSAMLRQMLRPESSSSEIDVSCLVEALAPVLRVASHGRKLTIDGARGAFVRADPLDIERAVINLVRNAHDATREGGEVTVSTRLLEQSGDLPSGRWVVMMVEDDGDGMDALTLERALTGYFTTKDAGTGLGLQSVSRIVRGLGGVLRIDSAPKRGTRVRLLLPFAGDP